MENNSKIRELYSIYLELGHEVFEEKIKRDFYCRALGSLVVLSFPHPLNFSSVFPSL
jgi:hypothetical protein